jgi:hypothetical protein
VLGNTRFISRVEHDISLVRCAHSWDIMFNTGNNQINGISAHPCIILYISRFFGISLEWVIFDGYCRWKFSSENVCNVYNMSGRVVSDIQTRAEGESLYIRYNTDANVVNNLKNVSSYKFIGEVILKLTLSKLRKSKLKFM